MAKKGFTLIEVSLFLAITGLLFLGVTIGVQTSISRQRQNDSVQSFVEFLRTAYSEVSNVQNINGGRSDWALYGKLITFGENQDKDKDQNSIYSYDVLGRTDGNTSALKAVEILKELDSDVIMIEKGKVKLVGIPQSYVPKWGASIEEPCLDNGCDYRPFVGALLIVRHPISGIIYTYVSHELFNVNEEAYRLGSLNHDQNITEETEDIQNVISGNGILFSKQNIENYSFNIEQVDFCINPDPGTKNNHRRDIRIIRNAKNSSGVEIISDDESKCKEN